jgi:hypothetical protein
MIRTARSVESAIEATSRLGYQSGWRIFVTIQNFLIRIRPQIPIGKTRTGELLSAVAPG